MGGMAIRKERRFHDAWAAVLLALTAGGTSTLGIINLLSTNTASTSTTPVLSGLQNKLFIVCGVFLAISILMMCLLFLLAAYAAPLLIYLGLLAGPVLTLIGVFMAPSLGSIVMFGLTLMSSFYIYTAYVRHYIDYISMVVSYSVQILANYIGTLIIIELAMIALGALTALPTLTLDSSTPANQALKTLSIFAMIWTGVTTTYLTQVLVSSLVLLHIAKAPHVRFTALRNMLYAAGSAAFAGLIVAVVQMLRNAVEQRQNERDQRREGGAGAILTTILLVLLKFVLYFLEAIIQSMNRLAMPYLAMRGESYKDSVTGSWQLFQSMSAARRGAMVCVSLVTFIMTFSTMGILGSGVVCGILMAFAKTPEMEIILTDLPKYLGFSLLIMSVVAVIAFEIVSLIDSAAMAIVYADAVEPQALSEYDKEKAYALRQLRVE